MPQQTISQKRATKIAEILQTRMGRSNGTAEVKDFHTDPDSGEVYQIDFNVGVGDNLPYFESLRGVALGWCDEDIEHAAAHWVLRASKHDGLSGL